MIDKDCKHKPGLFSFKKKSKCRKCGIKIIRSSKNTFGANLCLGAVFVFYFTILMVLFNFRGIIPRYFQYLALLGVALFSAVVSNQIGVYRPVKCTDNS
jgi:hypothetical protein